MYLKIILKKQSKLVVSKERVWTKKSSTQKRVKSLNSNKKNQKAKKSIEIISNIEKYQPEYVLPTRTDKGQQKYILDGLAPRFAPQKLFFNPRTNFSRTSDTYRERNKICRFCWCLLNSKRHKKRVNTVIVFSGKIIFIFKQFFK